MLLLALYISSCSSISSAPTTNTKHTSNLSLIVYYSTPFSFSFAFDLTPPCCLSACTPHSVYPSIHVAVLHRAENYERNKRESAQEKKNMSRAQFFFLYLKPVFHRNKKKVKHIKLCASLDITSVSEAKERVKWRAQLSRSTTASRVRALVRSCGLADSGGSDDRKF